MKMSPCKDCERRSPGCHDHCDDYKEWKAELDEKKMIREEALKEDRMRPIWTKTMRKRRLYVKGKWPGKW